MLRSRHSGCRRAAPAYSCSRWKSTLLQVLQHCVGQCFRLLEVGEMTAGWQDSECGFTDLRLIHVPLGDRHHAVVFARDDELRALDAIQIGRQIGIVRKLPGKPSKDLPSLEHGLDRLRGAHRAPLHALTLGKILEEVVVGPRHMMETEKSRTLFLPAKPSCSRLTLGSS